MHANTHVHTHVFLLTFVPEFRPRWWLLSGFRFDDVSSHLLGYHSIVLTQKIIGGIQYKLSETTNFFRPLSLKGITRRPFFGDARFVTFIFSYDIQGDVVTGYRIHSENNYNSRIQIVYTKPLNGITEGVDNAHGDWLFVVTERNRGIVK
jgi:hypothetical protein